MPPKLPMSRIRGAVEDAGPQWKSSWVVWNWPHLFSWTEEHPDGGVELMGATGTMPLQIIDTGYGLERFVGPQWNPTIYEAIYPETVAWLKECSI